MNETVLWLLYLAGAAAAFTAVQKFGWPIVAAMLGGTVITVAGWGLLYLLTSHELRPIFWKLDLSLNASFGLIFAGAGAALALALSHLRRG